MVRKTSIPEAENIEEQASATAGDTVENQEDVLQSEDGSAEAAAVVIPDPAVVDAIIRKRVYAAVGVGFVPLPLVDFAALTAVQLEMIHALSKVYGVEFKKERVKSIISSLLGGAATVAAVPFLSSLLKGIPIIGLPVGAATISITGGATTYALGWVFERHFRQGGTLNDFNMDDAKATFKTKVKEGKEFVSKMASRKKTDDTVVEATVADAAVPSEGEATPA